MMLMRLKRLDGHDLGSSTGFHGLSNFEVQRQCLVDNLEDYRIVKQPVPEGGCILHHQNISHRSCPNVPYERHRRALIVHLIRGDVRFIPKRGYIYGRYKLNGSDDLWEEFFPTIFWRPIQQKRLVKMMIFSDPFPAYFGGLSLNELTLVPTWLTKGQVRTQLLGTLFRCMPV